MIITLCVLKVVVTQRWKNASRPLGDGDGLPLPRGDTRGRHRRCGAVLRGETEDLPPHTKREITEATASAAARLGSGRTFLFSSMRISTTMFWNLMSNMAATVSSLALISVGPNTTAMLEAVIRFSSQRLHTLRKDTQCQAGGFEGSETTAMLA